MELHGIPCPKPRQNSMEFHGTLADSRYSIILKVPLPSYGKNWASRAGGILRYVNGASSHKIISSSDVSKLRRSNDHVEYGDRKTINVKAVCTCERHGITSSDN